MAGGSTSHKIDLHLLDPVFAIAALAVEPICAFRLLVLPARQYVADIELAAYRLDFGDHPASALPRLRLVEEGDVLPLVGSERFAVGQHLLCHPGRLQLQPLVPT